MKIFKSIKWRLQLWYGLILVVVLAGFGFTAYQLERGRLLGRVDQELHRRAGLLANALHHPPPRPNRDEPSFDRPPPDRIPDGTRPDEDLRPPPAFHLPPEAAGLFGTTVPNNFYFIIEGRNGRELAHSDNVPQSEVDFQHKINTGNGEGLESPAAPQASVNFEHNRGIFQRLPAGETIYVACSIAPELRELKVSALKLAGFGAVILFFGLAGGWWFVSRSLRPVENISAAAVKISAGDLSQRINVAEAESELGRLAAVLNSTFARLEAAFAQQQQFTSDAAHELRTPVSVILAQTQTVLNRERSAEDYKLTVEACQRAAQRMRKLIESLLALARFDAGQEVLSRRPFDFSKIICDCLELVQPLASERGVKTVAEIFPLPVNGNAERLAQVVTNLLTNAIQYNRAGGEVRLKLKAQNGLAILTVADTGQGIAPENLPRVFGRFFRADPARTGAGSAGLGLAICKAIVEAHGGTINVASEEKSGSTFTVRLPLV